MDDPDSPARILAAILVTAILLIVLIGEAMNDNTLRRRAYGCVALILISLAGLILALWALIPLPSPARNLDHRYDTAPFHQWYEAQHNGLGAWCCNNSDAHEYDGTYALHRDGSVSIELAGGTVRIEAFKVLNGPNPTGHAVWWHLGSVNGVPVTYCFAPGPLS